ncbi:MAG: 4Fe-4S binding protein [Candidatus Omnitrophica bacterium]|nr:4Fe-4S binding protein [Candidatus Omnitrophota bacterium]
MDLNSIRVAIQWVCLIGSNAYLGFVSTKQVYQGSLKGACVPFLNCHACPSALFSCPIGTMQHYITTHKFPFSLLGYLVGTSLLVGSMACGWLCPFGFLQDLAYKIKSFKIRIPEKLAPFRYFILVFLVILLPAVTHETWFSKLCPMGTLQAALPWALWNPIIPVYNEPAVATAGLGMFFAIKILILLFFLGLFVISKRPFCKVICPLGAIFGLFNKYSFFRLKVDTKACKDCAKCVDTCPVDINVGDDANSSTCVRCLKCLKCEHVKIDLGGLSDKIEFKGLGPLKKND